MTSVRKDIKESMYLNEKIQEEITFFYSKNNDMKILLLQSIVMLDKSFIYWYEFYLMYIYMY
jgi:hypothetical protein